MREDTPLHIAATYNQVEVARALVRDIRVEVNALEYRACTTPLHRASRHGHVGVVDVLLGCNDIRVNALNNLRLTPLHFAARYGMHEAVATLLKHPHGALWLSVRYFSFVSQCSFCRENET